MGRKIPDLNQFNMLVRFWHCLQHEQVVRQKLYDETIDLKNQVTQWRNIASRWEKTAGMLAAAGFCQACGGGKKKKSCPDPQNWHAAYEMYVTGTAPTNNAAK